MLAWTRLDNGDPPIFTSAKMPSLGSILDTLEIPPEGIENLFSNNYMGFEKAA